MGEKPTPSPGKSLPEEMNGNEPNETKQPDKRDEKMAVPTEGE